MAGSNRRGQRLGGSGALTPRRTAFLFQAATAAAVIALDHLSKWIVTSALAPGREWPQGGLVAIHYTENRGAAFSLLPQFQWVFLVAAVLVSVYILGWGYRIGATPYRQIVLGAILGGAISNALDRFTQGYVVDFIDLRRWPVFNLADCAIVIGVVLAIFTFGPMRKAAGQPAGSDG